MRYGVHYDKSFPHSLLWPAQQALEKKRKDGKPIGNSCLQAQDMSLPFSSRAPSIQVYLCRLSTTDRMRWSTEYMGHKNTVTTEEENSSFALRKARSTFAWLHGYMEMVVPSIVGDVKTVSPIIALS